MRTATPSWPRIVGCRGAAAGKSHGEHREPAAGLCKAVDTELTPRQRKVFVAIVLDDVPPDALVLSLSSIRNAIYKMLFDARRKLPGRPCC